jgi:hypothetical protein
MMGHPLVTALAVTLLAAGAVSAAVQAAPTFGLVAAGLVLLLSLMAERAVAGIRAWTRFGDAVALAFPLVHLARNMAWVAAIMVWSGRRLVGKPVKPEHSMTARAAAR